MENNTESSGRKVILGKHAPEAAGLTPAAAVAPVDGSLGFIERRRFPRPLPAPVVTEKNSDSIWAEFDDVVPYKKEAVPAPVTPPKAVDNQDPAWLDTILDNGLADRRLDKDI